MLDNLIKAVYDADLSVVVYYVFHVLSFVGVFVFAFYMRKKYHLDEKLSKIKFAVLVAVLFASMYIWMILLYTAVTGKLNGSFNTVRGVVWLPLIALPFAKLYKIKWETICDILAPSLCLVQGIGHLGCIFPGCCRSRFEWSLGIYNVHTQTKMFPIQPVESIIAFIIVIILVRLAKRKNYSSEGYLYPLMMVLFGSTRFICEFIRYDMISILGISRLGYHALLMTIVGAVWLIIYHCRRKKHPELAVCGDAEVQELPEAERTVSKTSLKNKSAAKNASKKKHKSSAKR